MTASEFAFMALGLVVGLSSGAALLYVIRARPRAPREIRLTVASDAVPRRIPATLSTGAFAAPAEPARGGPADRRAVDRPPEVAVAVMRAADAPAARMPETDVPMAEAPVPETPVPEAPVPAPPTTLVVASAGDPAVTAREARSGIPVHFEPDPAMEALRSIAPEAALVGAAPSTTAVDDQPSREGDRTVSRDVEYDVAYEAGQRAVLDAKPDTRPHPTFEAISSVGPGPSGEPVDPSTPCADVAAHVDDRCRQADLARLGSDAAARAVAAVRRDQQRERRRADQAREATDPVRLHEQKETARATFRADRLAATNRDGLDEAARAWLASINRLNAATRKADHVRTRADAAAAALMPALERLSAEADAARVAAESAAQGCTDAQAALAACRESLAARSAGAEVAAMAPSIASPSAPSESSATVDAEPAGATLAAPDLHVAPELEVAASDLEVAAPDLEVAAPEPASDLAPADQPAQAGRLSVADGTPVVLRIVRGDREARTRVAASLDRALPEANLPWADLLAELADAIRLRAIEESIIDVSSADPFWAPFTLAEAREIVRALAALGFRYDGTAGWSDEHVPVQRDLSMAVGYAGHDPMRIRQWPSEGAIAELFKDAQVGAVEYLEASGGQLSLGEVVESLGPHADSLTGLWDAWDSVRPLLLAEDDLAT